MMNARQHNGRDQNRNRNKAAELPPLGSMARQEERRAEERARQEAFYRSLGMDSAAAHELKEGRSPNFFAVQKGLSVASWRDRPKGTYYSPIPERRPVSSPKEDLLELFDKTKQVTADVSVGALRGALVFPRLINSSLRGISNGRLGNEYKGALLRPEETDRMLQGWYSDAYKTAEKAFEQAEGIADSAATLLRNPAYMVSQGVKGTIEASPYFMTGPAGSLRSLVGNTGVNAALMGGEVYEQLHQNEVLNKIDGGSRKTQLNGLDKTVLFGGAAASAGLPFLAGAGKSPFVKKYAADMGTQLASGMIEDSMKNAVLDQHGLGDIGKNAAERAIKKPYEDFSGYLIERALPSKPRK